MKERFVIVSGSVERLILGQDGLWKDIDGTIWGFTEESEVDPIDRCGIGIFSLPSDSPLTGACKVHDNQYSNRTFQYFHTRAEADLQLAENLSRAPTILRLLSTPFYYLSRIFGGRYWENNKTNF